ncbi:processive 1,2-diacylglycerol beta-glucosyltransferase [Caminicella sporogenes DSM 14501]|uniref:Processive 1,2-diacylglycerol beta-glucosyltransferase n=1 Tax=Caminicella sporogenes DSM 14501 TaxID=1121266 RepID=A0A1M6MH29_9FIRM|nr:glycosyltransferase [Caminicella sporogenes]RKD27553.1 hypothetical protein BET04_00330 [Caminicella sporogenes]SHJ82757.1 processive 1,2-diacylglycerol beta-glucosyltransferase [Caminicella sporogenes DSM 14501]
MNILFFTVSAGEGHNQVAKTLSEAIYKTGKNHNVKIIDTFNYINSNLHKFLMKSYIRSIKYIPELYGYFYKKTEEIDSSLHDFGELINKIFISRKLSKLLSDFKPDIIVCTHPFPAEALSVLKRKNSISVPIITTLTDYTLHPIWINKEIDYYIISSEVFKYELDFWNINPSKAKFFGIPVRERFYLKLDREKLCSKFNIKNIFTALLMGGGLGLGNIIQTLDYLLNYKIDIQIIVITGKNQELYKKLNEKYVKNSKYKNLRVFGFVSNIDEIMSVSDIIITKPGGITITEALIKELPIIITSNLPGQEERNTEFILNNGIGMLATNPNTLISSINILKDNREKYNFIKYNMSKLKKPNATKDIVNFILSKENMTSTS